VRNRSRILEAAEEVFGTEGLAVPVDRIAERAEVGVGTLYRHFPTKEALFEAIVLRHFEGIVAKAREAQSADDPTGALFGLLQGMVATAVRKRDLADALIGAGIDFKATAGDLKVELEGCIARLLERAQEEGSVRADVSADELMALVAGGCMYQGGGALTGSPERMLEIVCDGLRARRD
jgi:AcrR family transcriptional regulator